MKTGEIWAVKPGDILFGLSEIPQKIKLLSYIGDDYWSVKDMKVKDTGRMTGDKIYTHYHKIGEA